jgi:predicted nucleic acid-binding protein
MNLVDSSGWMEYFIKGENCAFFAPVIKDIGSLVVSTINMYEVYKKTALQCGEEEALSAIGWMSTGRVVDITQEIALAAAILSLEHKLPMADSLILATAHTMDAILWTQDEHFEDLEGVQYTRSKD